MVALEARAYYKETELGDWFLLEQACPRDGSWANSQISS
jgi:hypothetical protein